MTWPIYAFKDHSGSPVENEHGEVARGEVRKPVRSLLPTRQVMLMAGTRLVAGKVARC